MRPLGPRTREHAANLCSSRAAAEADPMLCVGPKAGSCACGRRAKSNGSAGDHHVWTPHNWSAREGKIAYRAFQIAVARNGCGFGKAPINWGLAEAMLRTGEIDELLP